MLRYSGSTLYSFVFISFLVRIGRISLICSTFAAVINCYIYMYKWKRYIGAICLICSLSMGAMLKAEPVDSIRISLLTCSPGTKIYTLFGHTALRYEDPARGIDVVFNYGMFSFNAPNFIWRFVKGETDYMLGVVPFDYFQGEYAERGSAVYQQTLNLLPEEKKKLADLLEWNSRKENRVYRYNFFFDNCTTRARDRIEESIDGTVHYRESDRVLSFRDIVHQYTKGHEWAQFGIDLCLGSEADAPIDYRTQMFAPFYLSEAADSARVVRQNGQERSFITVKQIIVPASAGGSKSEHYWLKPLQAAWLLFFFTLSVSLYGIWKRKTEWWLDIVLFGAAGAAGCVLTFLVFFSVHPTVSPNYLLLFLNPIHLFYLPFQVYLSMKRKKDWYHWINMTVLTLFMLLFGCFPQKINPAVLPLAASLWIRSASHVWLMYKKKE